MRHLTEGYGIAMKLGHISAIANIGVMLAQALMMAGEREDARPILERSRAGFLKLGQPDDAAQVDALLQALGDPSPE